MYPPSGTKTAERFRQIELLPAVFSFYAPAREMSEMATGPEGPRALPPSEAAEPRARLKLHVNLDSVGPLP
jgi:hypothetical protein